MDEKRSLYSMQQEVDEYIQQFKVGYFSPLAQLARLTEEVGELAREVNDLTDVFEKNMEKFNHRDHNRFERKDK